MNVILLEKIGKLGEIGDTASVKAGYARNFLFPKGKAIPATKANLAEFEERKADLLAAHNEKVAASQARAAKVEGASLTIEVNASDEGKLFGSVGTREIADALNAQAGSDVSKAEVLMPHGVIRDLGTTELTIDLGHDVAAQITVNVVGLQSAADVSADGSIIEEEDESEAEVADEAPEGSEDDSSEGADEAES
ncbi:MAG: 50S ribosomal protein L9 [Gammaproteobacteria bacterium]|jgi:large subunit ribosomal protein L9|nr:50S ribosomal protein L9 [Gammaproteobacteria bacterium]